MKCWLGHTWKLVRIGKILQSPVYDLFLDVSNYETVTEVYRKCSVCDKYEMTRLLGEWKESDFNV